MYKRQIENPAGDTYVAMRDPENPGRSLGLEVGSAGRMATSFAMAPGPWIVGCFAVETYTSAETPVSAYGAAFEVVDPDGNWARIQDASTCGDPLPAPAETAGAETDLAGPLSGRLLVEVRDDDTGAMSFYAVNANGSGAQRLFPDLVVDDVQFSPDGSRVALVISDSDGDPTVTYAAREDGEIYVANADGSDLTRLTDNRASDDILHWTPDGTRLSFRSNRDGEVALYTMNADGSDAHQIIPEGWSADSHDWSADGSQLVFVGSDGREDGHGCRGDHEIQVMQTGDGSVTALTDDEWYEQSPIWSPDGSRIAFSASDQSDYAWEIFTMNADGSDMHRVTDFRGYDAGPVWSPDGSMLVFTSDRAHDPDPRSGHQGGLPFVMNADGSGVQPLFTEAQLDAMGIAPGVEVFVEDWRA